MNYNPLHQRIDEIRNIPITDELTPWGRLNLIHAATDFGKRPPQLGDFIPCVDGVPVEKPVWQSENDEYYGDALKVIQDTYYYNLAAYKSACERVLFEGFEIVHLGRFNSLVALDKKTGRGQIDIRMLKTLSDISEFNLKLTAYGQKLYENGTNI